MITAIVALAIAQQPSYFVATFPNPTGNNGWEEYTRALDLVRGLGARSALANGLVESRNLNSKTLDAVDLVRAGNRKPLVYPWKLDLIEIDDRNPSILFVD